MTSAPATRNPDVATRSAPISPATWHRLGGASWVVGCALLAGGDLIRVAAGTDPGNPMVAVGWFIEALGAMLAVLGLPGIYVRHVAGTGILGLIGLGGITVFLFLFGIFGGLLHTVAVPELARQGIGRPHGVGLTFLTGAIFVVLGSVALGIATIRSRASSRLTGVLLIVGGLALFVGHPIGRHAEDLGLVLLMAGLAWAGSDPSRRTSARR